MSERTPRFSNPAGVARGSRETFASRLGLLATMIGVAVGLGNVWRFPYMVGKFGGAPFVLFYLLVVVLLGVPALMAEWALGRQTRRGPVGAFAGAGFPLGKPVGWFFFFVVTAAAAYYTNAIGWVAYHGVGEMARLLSLPWPEGAILPPETGFDLRAFLLQALFTGLVILASVAVLLRGLRSGIEGASRFLVPALFVTLLVLILRSVTLPGAWTGIEWYILKFEPGALSAGVMMAAVGQAVFSLSLGGTFMVVYGSYLGEDVPLGRNALWTAAGDTGAGLLAGFAVLPAVFALGLEPGSGPGLIFFTLPRVFEAIPLGALFGALFFFGLAGAAYLSLVAGFEVLVAGLTDNTGLRRHQAVWIMAAAVFLLALPPMVNMEIFVPWDLTFGSGMQIFGSFLAVLAVAWAMDRAAALRQLAGGTGGGWTLWLYYWLRFVIPGALIGVGCWWLLGEVLGVTR